MRNEIVTLAEDTLTELTISDALTVTVQVRGTYPVILIPTTGGAPADPMAGLEFNVGGGYDKAKLAEMLPGVPGAVRLFAYAWQGPSTVFISHDEV